jgi:hypothetical protein
MQQSINRHGLIKIHGNEIISFLDMLENTKYISNGVWNKLYALVAVAREHTNTNYTTYDGYTQSFDTINRSVAPRSVENGCSIGDMIRGKQ